MDEINGLTPREREVVAGYAKGLTDDEIADAMGITRHTVRTFGERIRYKLGARTRAHVVALLRGER